MLKKEQRNLNLEPRKKTVNFCSLFISHCPSRYHLTLVRRSSVVASCTPPEMVPSMFPKSKLDRMLPKSKPQECTESTKEAMCGRIGVCKRPSSDVHNGVVGIPAFAHGSLAAHRTTPLLLPALTMSTALESPFRVDCLRGKVALVTGGGSGICFQISRQIGEV